jgi:hypothetical protein
MIAGRFRRRVARLSACCALSLLLAALPQRAQAQATPNPPDRMTYQGYLVDANGNPLGNTNPKNYDVIFRVWNDQSSTDVSHRLWAEQQTVTMDKGYFSVLLGEGSQYSTEPHGAVSSLFNSADASERYVEITVKGIGAGGTDSTILPRLRLLTSPYSFLAQKAVNAGALVNNSNVAIVTASGTTMTVNGSLTANSLAGNGANLTGLNGSAITSGTVPDSRLSPNVALRAGGNNLSGNQTVTNGAFVGDGTIPVGGIIMWSGAIANIPSGWALCDGELHNGQQTPDLRDRFVVGAGSTYALGASGGNASHSHGPGGYFVPGHSHSITWSYESGGGGQGWLEEGAGSPNYRLPLNSDVAGPLSVSGTSASTSHIPPYFALAFIMRVR